MKKILLMTLVLSAVLSIQNAYAWYTDCNVTSARDTSFTNPGSAQPPGGEQYCGMVFFRIKKEVGKPPEAEVLKGNFSEVLKEAPKPAKEIEVQEKRQPAE